MIAFPGMLAACATAANMKTPDDPENFDPVEFPHFHVYLSAQLGAPMPTPGAHWDNAKVVAKIGPRKIKMITYAQLEKLGFAGRSQQVDKRPKMIDPVWIQEHEQDRIDRLETVISDLASMLDENEDEAESDWHGYVGEAYTALLAAVGDPTGAKHPRGRR